jgi:hypothetical protein
LQALLQLAVAGLLLLRLLAQRFDLPALLLQLLLEGLDALGGALRSARCSALCLRECAGHDHRRTGKERQRPARLTRLHVTLPCCCSVGVVWRRSVNASFKSLQDAS